jgi:hypothetical protein
VLVRAPQVAFTVRASDPEVGDSVTVRDAWCAGLLVCLCICPSLVRRLTGISWRDCRVGIMEQMPWCAHNTLSGLGKSRSLVEQRVVGI